MFKKVSIILLALLGVIDSAYTLIIYNKIMGSQFAYKSICAISDFVNCDVVITSKFGKILGIPVSIWGIIVYVALLIFSILHFLYQSTDRRIYYSYLFGISFFNSLFSIYLFAISLLVIKALCLLCTGIYIINLLLLTISTIEVLRSAISPFKLFYEHALYMFRERTLLSVSVIILSISTLLFIYGQDIKKEKREWRERYNDFFKLDSKYYNIEIGNSPIAGSDNAGITIVEFSDFQCPFCKNADESLDKLLKKYKGKIKLVFKHFPLDRKCNYLISRTIHENACNAAIASLCANKLGNFWDYRVLLFKNQKILNTDKLYEIAYKSGLNLDEFKKCLETPDSIFQDILSDIHLGYRLGIHSTPTLFINGKMVKGAPPEWLLEEMIQHELKLSN